MSVISTIVSVIIARSVDAEELHEAIESFDVLFRSLKPLLRFLDKLLLKPLAPLCTWKSLAELLELAELLLEILAGLCERGLPVSPAVYHPLLVGAFYELDVVFEPMNQAVTLGCESHLPLKEFDELSADEFENAVIFDRLGFEIRDTHGLDVVYESTSVGVVRHVDEHCLLVFSSISMVSTTSCVSGVGPSGAEDLPAVEALS